MRYRGFTLVEMLVAVGIFTIIMVLALGALLVLSGADRRAEDLKLSVDNLNFALDSMSRTMRTGANYDCGIPTAQDPPMEHACPSGSNYFAFQAQDGSLVEYQLSCSGQSCAVEEQITKNGQSAGWQPITSPNISLTNTPLFFMVGTKGSVQPKVTILLHGSVAGDATATFNLQTSVAQRLYDQ